VKKSLKTGVMLWQSFYTKKTQVLLENMAGKGHHRQRGRPEKPRGPRRVRKKDSLVLTRKERIKLTGLQRNIIMHRQDAKRARGEQQRILAKIEKEKAAGRGLNIVKALQAAKANLERLHCLLKAEEITLQVYELRSLGTTRAIA